MLLVPDFYKRFKCVADKCADSCCVGWEIDVDCHTLAKYREMGNDKIFSHIATDAEIPYIRLSADEKCPFLDERGLCRIISKYGDDYIPEICKKHPRYNNEILDFTECSIGLSCPTAAEIILSLSDKPEIESIPTFSGGNEKNEVENPTNEEETVEYLCKIRDMLFDGIFDKKRDAVGVVSWLLRCQTAVSDYLFDGVPIGKIEEGMADELYPMIDLIPKAFSHLELLSEDLRTLVLRATREHVLSLLAKHTDVSRALLYYFLHRYMLSGASDFDLDDRLTLCVMLLFICLVFIGERGVVDGAVLFSKNIEYSTENIDILLDIIAERY